MHCKFFSPEMHDYQSWKILRCSLDVEFTSDSCTRLRDVMQMYYDLSTSYQLCWTLRKIFYHLQDYVYVVRVDLFSLSIDVRSVKLHLFSSRRDVDAFTATDRLEEMYWSASGSRKLPPDVAYISRVVVEMYWNCKYLQCIWSSFKSFR